MHGNSGVVGIKMFFVYAVCSVAAILYLPYLVPLTPSASSSYLFGYNNKAGVALVPLFVALGVYWTRGLRLSFRGAADSPPASRKTLIFSLIAVLLGCIAMYLLAGRFGGFGESSYEIDRIWLTSIGKHPYVDFEWPFGVMLLYGPLALHRLLFLDLIHANYLFWGLNSVLGVWLLFVIVNDVNYPSSRKKAIFLLLYCAWFLSIVNMGTHYTLTRYTLPLYFILLLQKQIKRGSVDSYVLGSFLILAITILLLLYSPEVAIAFALASVSLFLVLAEKRDSEFVVAFSGLLPALGLVFWAALKLHVLDTVMASGGGSDSFPIVCSLSVLLFFAALFVCACYAYQRFTGQRLNDNSIGLIFFSIPMLTAALSRCDPGHILLNGLGIFLASLFYASDRNAVWKYSKAAFAVIFIVLPAVGGLWLYVPSLAKCAAGSLAASGRNARISRSLMGAGKIYIDHFAAPDKKEKWKQKLEDLLQGKMPEPADLTVIYPTWQGSYLAPFGYRPNGVGTDLTTQVDYGRYEGVENANTRAAINAKVSEIRDNPGKALLLPDQYESFCEIDVHAERRVIEFLFAAPYFKTAVHPESVRRPICIYIQEHYSLAVKPSRQTFFYGLWINRRTAIHR